VYVLILVFGHRAREDERDAGGSGGGAPGADERAQSVRCLPPAIP